MPHAVPARPQASRLFIGGAFALLVVLGLCVVGARGYASATRLVEHTLYVQAELDAWTTLVIGLQNDTRGYVASARPDFVDDFEEQKARAHAQVARLRELVADNPRQTKALDEADRISVATTETVVVRDAQTNAGAKAPLDQSNPRHYRDDASEGQR